MPHKAGRCAVSFLQPWVQFLKQGRLRSMTIRSLMTVSSGHRQERYPAGDNSVPSVRVACGYQVLPSHMLDSDNSLGHRRGQRRGSQPCIPSRILGGNTSLLDMPNPGLILVSTFSASWTTGRSNTPAPGATCCSVAFHLFLVVPFRSLQWLFSHHSPHLMMALYPYQKQDHLQLLPPQ